MFLQFPSSVHINKTILGNLETTEVTKLLTDSKMDFYKLDNIFQEYKNALNIYMILKHCCLWILNKWWNMFI